MKKYFILFFSLLWLAGVTFSSDKKPIYMDPSYTIERRIGDLIKRMSLKEKIALLHGEGFNVPGNQRLSIPALKMSDGPAGIRWGKATAFPAPIALAATWDSKIVEKTGKAMAEELKAKGRNVLLAPCVNIHRIPTGGRNFESYGEDPYLAGKIAAAFIRGVQGEKVIACVKHYVANNQEWNRGRLNVIADERALNEIYLSAFKAAVKNSGVLCVMAAYNKVNGEYCSENRHLLIDILKTSWGFKGFVVSDWGATHSTVKAALSGLDLEMPYGRYFGEKLFKAVKEGKISEAIINEKVKRILYAMFQTGFFPMGIDEEKEKEEKRERLKNTKKLFEAHAILSRKIAEESMVLLKNNGILPLKLENIDSIAVIGPNARHPRTGGGGSAMVKPFYAISPLAAIEKLEKKGIKIYYAPGAEIKGDILPVESRFLTYMGKNGLQGEYFNNSNFRGNPVFKRMDEELYFNWSYDMPEPELEKGNDSSTFSIRWNGTIIPPVSGKYRLKFLCDGNLRVYINNQKVYDDWRNSDNRRQVSPRNFIFNFKKEKSYKIQIEYSSSPSVSEFKFGWDIPGKNLINEAVSIAKRADIVLIFAGLSPHFETESRDRPSMEIPNQNELINKILKVNKKTVIVLINGSPVNITSWANKVPAILEAWYPGQEEGNAILNVLLGKHNPSGKLPFSWIKSAKDCPGYEGYMDKSLNAHYREGIFVGYRYLDRKGIEPLFPFGYGLSYTDFKYSELKIIKLPDGNYRVRLKIKNTGNLAGAEVIQIYVKPPLSEEKKPVKELKAFKKIYIKPGEEKILSIDLEKKSLAYYSSKNHRWIIERGEYEILVGSSSRDIRIKGKIKI